MTPGQVDRSNGWEQVAKRLIEDCQRSTVGVATLESWTQLLPQGASVLDLGCGPGGLRSDVLFERGFSVYGVDASPSLIEAYRTRYSRAQATCEPVEVSLFFGRRFDAVLAWGLIFLRPAEMQRTLIQRVAHALVPGGRFLFTAPRQECTWPDASTGRKSLSLGERAYRATLEHAGLTLEGQFVDEGENHYYSTMKNVTQFAMTATRSQVHG